jgi:hypothetical protein
MPGLRRLRRVTAREDRQEPPGARLSQPDGERNPPAPTAELLLLDGAQEHLVAQIDVAARPWWRPGS